jgi:hypothetical protein
MHEGRQQVGRPVVALRAKGSISDGEVVAATRYYDDYAFGVHGADIATRAGSGGGVDGYSIAQIEALGRYLDVMRGLGPLTAAILDTFVIHEKTIRAMAGPSGARQKQLSTIVVTALKDLADHYDRVDNARPAKSHGRFVDRRA